MTNKPTSKSKSKKVLDTTLGKAQSYSVDDPIDLSHVRKPIETSIFGLTQVLRLFETATDEVRRYVAYECDLMYECRICRTIYRSLANFILHKRNYCTESYRSSVNSRSRKRFRQHEFNLLNQETNVYNCDNSRANSPEHLDSNEIPEAPVSNTKIETKKRKDLGIVLNRLHDKQESIVITEQCLSEEISNESQNSEKECHKNNIALQKLNGSNAGVYQTIFPHLMKNSKMDFMKTEVMEIHDILENNEAILGIDGKILVADTEKNSVLKNNYTCSVCNQKFSTKKTLIHHIRYKHNPSNLIYPCTECRETFANTWGVFRHLYKVHQKSTTQVRKLRNLIHDSAIKRSDEIGRKTNVVLRSSSSSELPEKSNLHDQQWMDNLEGDNDLQRCGGCGRKFERKAALHSHSQFCAKRIAVCNALKESTNKKVQVEEKPDKVNKASRNGFTHIERVRRRKPLVAQKIHRFTEYNDMSMLEDIIGPLPRPNISFINKGDADTDNITSCQVSVKNELKDISTRDKCSTFFVGSVTVSKVQKPDNISQTVSEIENMPREEFGDNLNKEDEHDPIKPEKICKTNSTNVINITATSTNGNIEQEVKQHNLDLPIEACNSNINCRCASELKNEECASPKKSKSSLAKKSLSYIDIEKQICLPCKKRFNTYKLLMKHMALHFNWYRYQCSICKYRSYTKSKCRHHITLKHNISDKINLCSIAKRISRSKAHETSTSFIKNYKKKKVRLARGSTETIEENALVINDKTSPCSDKVTCDKIQDPLVRQMVMEVIFGTTQMIAQEPSLNDCSDKKDNDSHIIEEAKAIQNSLTSSQVILEEPMANNFSDKKDEDLLTIDLNMLKINSESDTVQKLLTVTSHEIPDEEPLINDSNDKKNDLVMAIDVDVFDKSYEFAAIQNSLIPDEDSLVNDSSNKDDNSLTIMDVDMLDESSQSKTIQNSLPSTTEAVPEEEHLIDNSSSKKDDDLPLIIDLDVVKEFSESEVIQNVLTPSTQAVPQEEHLINNSSDKKDDDSPLIIDSDMIEEYSEPKVIQNSLTFSTQVVPEQEHVINSSDKKDNNLPLIIDLDVIEECSESEAIQNSLTTNEVLALESIESQSQNISRPIRTRIMPLHKDFLYDMQVLRLKRTKKRKLKPKLHSKSVNFEKKISVVPDSVTSNINVNENSINCVQPVNKKPDNLIVEHVTGDFL